MQVRNQMANNFAEISMCAGFFIIYFVDEFLHYFFGAAADQQTDVIVANNTVSSSYGSINNETEPLLSSMNHQQHE